MRVVEQEAIKLKAWLEPEVRSLEVKETAQFPSGPGADGGSVEFPDCNSS
jgi:hypothetical protein